MDEVVLIVEDDRQVARALRRVLDSEGCHTEVAATGAEAREQMGQMYPDVVLMDLNLPDADGADLIEELSGGHPETTFIVLTGHGSIRSAVDTLRRGAADYLTKPFENEQLLLAIHNARRGRLIGEELRRLRGFEHPAKQADDELWRSAKPMLEMLLLAQRAAQRDGTVLLLGETGTGKDYFARWLHQRSARANGPFFALNCAAISPQLAESEFFGHEPGAFTGTTGRKRGLVELADKGTLLLNEIGELDMSLQTKLLSFLDTRSFVRVGGERTVRIDTRIIAATNRDLAAEVESRRFRKDLYYRLNVIPIRIPPLRERAEDIPWLANEILGELSREMALGSMVHVSSDAMASLVAYDWPGNVRELRNVLEHALIISGGRIEAAHLNTVAKSEKWSLSISFPTDGGMQQALKRVEAELIREALKREPTKTRAAKLLDLTRHQLDYRIKALGLRPSGSRSDAGGGRDQD